MEIYTVEIYKSIERYQKAFALKKKKQKNLTSDRILEVIFM